MAYPNYLIHFNKLHSRKNGQFISGDGDGDGTADEHHRYSKNGVKSKDRSGEDFDGYIRKNSLELLLMMIGLLICPQRWFVQLLVKLLGSLSLKLL